MRDPISPCLDTRDWFSASKIPQLLGENSQAFGEKRGGDFLCKSGRVGFSGKQCSKDIEDILAQTGVRKVNIIAHSNGGVEARYMIHELGMALSVASLTTICTCHHGSKTIDKLLRLPDFLFKIVAVLINFVFKVLGDRHPDFYHTCRQLSTEFCADFNRKIPSVDGVIYRSYAAKKKSAFSDITQVIPYLVVKHIDGDNDSLVPVESAKWFLRSYRRENAKRRISRGCGGCSEIYRKII